MRISVVLSVFLLLPVVGLGATVYVDGANTTGPWDGTKLYPFPTIQQGLDSALAGDTVLVLPGTYVENLDFKGNAVTLISEEGPAYSVVDGNQAGSVVKFVSGEGNDSVIEGFTLTNGQGTRETVPKVTYNGAGIYCVGSSPTIVRNVITDNIILNEGDGAGILCKDYSSPIIRENIITGNAIPERLSRYQFGAGGGICCKDFSDAQIVDNVISGNAAAYSGGGIMCLDNSSPDIIGNTISGNYGGYNYGGGIACKTNCFSVIDENVISDNWASKWGGGIYAWQSLPLVTNNVISGNLGENGGGIYFYDNSSSLIEGNEIFDNEALFDGGGIFCSNSSAPEIAGNLIHGNIGNGICCFNHSAPVIRDNIIYKNTSNTFGGGIYCINDSAPTITSNTVTDNTADYGGGLYCGFDSSSAVITNTILWNNHAVYQAKEIWVGDPSHPSHPTISHSVVEGGMSSVVVGQNCTLTWGLNMITDDPQFVDAASDDYHVGIDSPCIDIGHSTAPGIGAVDFDGQTRVFDSDGDLLAVAEIGADEVRPLHVPTDYASIQAAIDDAVTGETVLVQPGTYAENIDFSGKAIRLRSRGGYDVTVLDGGGLDSTVTFADSEGADSVLEGFTVMNGSAVYGGGILCSGAAPTIHCNFIRDNAADYGSGLYVENAALTLVNNIFAWNTGEFGAALGCANATVTLCNNTITENDAVQKGGGVHASLSSTVEMANTIVWKNTASSGPAIYLGDAANPSTLTIGYCDLDGGQASVHKESGCVINWDGPTMIDANPEFVHRTSGDFHLFFTSPCRDTGNSSATGLPETDFEGDPRVFSGSSEIGVDEFHTHLYITGDKTPEGMIDAKLVGVPGTGPVGLWFGYGVQKPALPSAYGEWHLIMPALGPFVLLPIPPKGVEIISQRLTNFPGPYSLPMQAIVGNKFTNLYILHVN